MCARVSRARSAGAVDRLLRAGERLELGDRREQPVDLAERGGRLVTCRVAAGGRLQLLQAHAQAGQRRAQLVRRVGGELALAPQQRGDPLVGRDQRVLDRVELLDAGGRRAPVEAGVPDRRGPRGEPLERAGEAPRLDDREPAAAAIATSDSTITASQTPPMCSVRSSRAATTVTRTPAVTSPARTRTRGPDSASPPVTIRPSGSRTSSWWPGAATEASSARSIALAAAARLGDPRGGAVGLALEPPGGRLDEQPAADDAERDAEQEDRGERDQPGGDEQPAAHQGSKRKPTPRTVVISGGVAELAAQPADVHVERLGRAPPVLVPHARISSSRRTTLPACSTSSASRSNSFGESSSSLVVAPRPARARVDAHAARDSSARRRRRRRGAAARARAPTARRA